MTASLAKRREYTNRRFVQLKEILVETESSLGSKACVYITGSFGRCEASEASDLDLFIIGARADDKDVNRDLVLKRLDEICLKADLVRAVKALRLPDFDGDGKYLSRNSVQELVNTLGHPQDDVLNRFTARLLLLLESRPLIGINVYDDAINDVIGAYRRILGRLYRPRD